MGLLSRSVVAALMAGCASVPLLATAQVCAAEPATDPSAVAQKPSGVQSAAPAAAQPLTPSQQLKGVYLTGAFGANWPITVTGVDVTPGNLQSYSFQDSHGSGFSAEAGLGYDFGAIRAEVTYAYDGSYINNYSDQYGSYQYTSNGYVGKQSVLASAYWDINLNSRFSPYIGGGVGYSSLSATGTADQLGVVYAPYTAGAFAYQLKAGLNYLLSRRSDVFAEAVYRGMAGYPVSDGPTSYWYNGYNSWGFQLGARYRF